MPTSVPIWPGAPMSGPGKLPASSANPWAQCQQQEGCSAQQCRNRGGQVNPAFVDTSVLIAAEDTRLAVQLYAYAGMAGSAGAAGSGCTSNQALVEFCDQATTAVLPLPQGDARAAIRRYQTWTPWKTDAATLETAWGAGPPCAGLWRLPGRGLRPAQRLQPDAEPASAPWGQSLWRNRGAPAGASRHAES